MEVCSCRFGVAQYHGRNYYCGPFRVSERAGAAWIQSGRIPMLPPVPRSLARQAIWRPVRSEWGVFRSTSMRTTAVVIIAIVAIIVGGLWTMLLPAFAFGGLSTNNITFILSPPVLWHKPHPPPTPAHWISVLGPGVDSWWIILSTSSSSRYCVLTQVLTT